MGYSFRLAARVLLYASSHRQDNTYHGLCYTSLEALAGTRNSSMGPPWRIDPTTHRTMSECSYHGATSRSLKMNVWASNLVPALLRMPSSRLLVCRHCSGRPTFKDHPLAMFKGCPTGYHFHCQGLSNSKSGQQGWLLNLNSAYTYHIFEGGQSLIIFCRGFFGGRGFTTTLNFIPFIEKKFFILFCNILNSIL